MTIFFVLTGIAVAALAVITAAACTAIFEAGSVMEAREDEFEY